MKSLSSATAFLLLLLATSAAFSALGVLLPAAQAFSRVLIPVSGVVLMLTSIAWVLPEVAETFGWPIAALAMAAATALLWLVDRYVYPVCPSCSHSHDHHSCSTRLHGFAVPMLIAVALHNLFDGWTVAFG
ncbi:MAG TPA: hypothetical protein VEQ63_10595, partial [Bryobacteraceae bacterium]|nr:hypothetical protein [Bryobacteraceae bacterium]